MYVNGLVILAELLSGVVLCLVVDVRGDVVVNTSFVLGILVAEDVVLVVMVVELLGDMVVVIAVTGVVERVISFSVFEVLVIIIVVVLVGSVSMLSSPSFSFSS